MKRSEQTCHRRRVALGVVAAAVACASCGGGVVVRNNTVPELTSGEGLVALAVAVHATQKANIHVSGPKGFTLSDVTPGMNNWVLKLPEGIYCDVMIEWQSVTIQSQPGEARFLNPCIDVRPGVLVYPGHYKLDLTGAMKATRLVDGITSFLHEKHPELLDRYPLQ